LQQKLLVRRNLRSMNNGAGLIQNAYRQKPGMQINAAVESVLSCVESHHGLRVRDVRWSCGNYQHTSCEEAMMSIKQLQLTGAAILAFRTSTSLQAAPATELFRSAIGEGA
jgi:hypothetical protein